MSLTTDQAECYRRQGYLALRSIFSRKECERAAEALVRAARCGAAIPAEPPFPSPGMVYAVGGNVVEDPILASFASHPVIVEAVEMLIGGPAVLSAFNGFIKTPGAAGTMGDYEGSHPTAHQDYKTYHHAGSSLNWLFAIVPMIDYDPQIGELRISPGSHLQSKVERAGPIYRVRRSGAHEIAPLVDLGLCQGDLLLMNMFTWHEAGPNSSDRQRIGLYNKYRAVNAPPASGPDLFSDAAHRIVTYRGRSLIVNHSDRPITTTLLLLQRGERYLMIRNGLASADEASRWQLVGMRSRGSSARCENVDHIEVLRQISRELLGIDLAWATYVGDFHQGENLSRVFAHVLSEASALRLAPEIKGVWWTREELGTQLLHGAVIDLFAGQAIDLWRDELVLRGVGESRRQARGAGRRPDGGGIFPGT